MWYYLIIDVFSTPKKKKSFNIVDIITIVKLSNSHNKGRHFCLNFFLGKKGMVKKM